MTNGYFNHNAPLARHTLARAEDLNARLGAVEAGFGRLPTEAELKQGRVTYATAAGAADSYHLTLPYPPTAYTEGMRVVWRVPAGAANAGPSAVNVNGLGVKPVLRIDGTPATRGDLPAGGLIDLCYDGTAFRLTSAHSGDLTLARDWAVKMGGPVEGNEYSAKHHATQAAGSAAAVTAVTAGAEAARAAAEGARDQAAASASAAATSAMTAEAMKASAETAGNQAAASASAASASAAGAEAAKDGSEAARDQALSSASAAVAAAANVDNVRTAAETARDQAVASASAAVTAAAVAEAAKVVSETARDQAASSASLAVAAAMSGGTFNAAGIAGTGNAVTVTVGAAVSGYFDLLTVRFVWPAPNTSTAPTLTLASSSGVLAPKTIRDAVGGVLAVGDLAAGLLVTATYVAAEDRWRIGSSDTGGIETGGTSPLLGVTLLTEAGTLAPSHKGQLVVCTGTASYSVSADPAVIGAGSLGLRNNTAGIVTLTTPAGVPINGLSGGWMLLAGESCLLVSNGAAFYTIGNGSTTASACVLSASDKDAGITLSDADLTAATSNSTATSYQSVRATGSILGKRYFEVRVKDTPSLANSSWIAGVAQTTAPFTGGSYGAFTGNGWGYSDRGSKIFNGTPAAVGPSLSVGDILGFYVDESTGFLWVSHNGVLLGAGNPEAGTNPLYTGLTGVLKPAFSGMRGAAAEFRFSLSSWAYSSSGFSPIA